MVVFLQRLQIFAIDYVIIHIRIVVQDLLAQVIVSLKSFLKVVFHPPLPTLAPSWANKLAKVFLNWLFFIPRGRNWIFITVNLWSRVISLFESLHIAMEAGQKLIAHQRVIDYISGCFLGQFISVE